MATDKDDYGAFSAEETQAFNGEEDQLFNQGVATLNYLQQQQFFQRLQPLQLPASQIKSVIVNEMRSYPAIWNNKSHLYKDQNKKMQSWKELSKKMCVEEETLKAEWAKLRENYSKCVSRRERMTRSGAETKKLPTCAFFEELCYLHDTIAPRSTYSNINLNNASQVNDMQSQQQLFIQQSFPQPSSLLSPAHSEYSPASTSSDSHAVIPQTTPKTKKKRSKTDIEDLQVTVDSMLVNYIKENSAAKSPNATANISDDADRMFCLSLVEPLKELPKNRNQYVKFKIQELLYKETEEKFDS